MRLFSITYHPHLITSIDDRIIVWILSVLVVLNEFLDLFISTAFFSRIGRLRNTGLSPIIKLAFITMFFGAACKKDEARNNKYNFSHDINFGTTKIPLIQ